MFVSGTVVVSGNLLVLRESHELRNLPRLPIKINYHLVLNMVTLGENIDFFRHRYVSRSEGYGLKAPPTLHQRNFKTEASL